MNSLSDEFRITKADPPEKKRFLRMDEYSAGRKCTSSDGHRSVSWWSRHIRPRWTVEPLKKQLNDELLYGQTQRLHDTLATATRHPHARKRWMVAGV